MINNGWIHAITRMFSPSLIDSTSSEIDVESSATKFNLLQKKTKKKKRKLIVLT